MPHKTLKRPQAARDIEECFVFIAKDNLDAGLKFLLAVEESVARLVEFPRVGKRKNFQDKRFQDVRMWQVKNHENDLIFYEVFEDRIEIIRVPHSARNIADLFD